MYEVPFPARFLLLLPSHRSVGWSERVGLTAGSRCIVRPPRGAEQRPTDRPSHSHNDEQQTTRVGPETDTVCEYVLACALELAARTNSAVLPVARRGASAVCTALCHPFTAVKRGSHTRTHTPCSSIVSDLVHTMPACNRICASSQLQFRVASDRSASQTSCHVPPSARAGAPAGAAHAPGRRMSRVLLLSSFTAGIICCRLTVAVRSSLPPLVARAALR